MDMSEINLNKVENEELLDIYSITKETIEFLENEINANEVENK